ncbi:hypothetical protein ACPCXF_10345 [Lysinibacillus agricola]
MGNSDRGTKAKTITSCDNAFVTPSCWPETLQRSEAAHRTPPGSSALCESEASATKRSVGTEINHTLWSGSILKKCVLLFLYKDIYQLMHKLFLIY